MSKRGTPSGIFPSKLPEERLAEFHRASCDACLLEFEASPAEASAEPRTRSRKPTIGLLDCCRHVFHSRCIKVWAKAENSCPQCRLRFTLMSEYCWASGVQRRISEFEHRDQIDWDALEAGSDSDDDRRCTICGGANDAALLLLCDGQQGQCPGAAHTYCDGLGRTVPSSSWFCQSCRQARTERKAPRRRLTRAHSRELLTSHLQNTCAGLQVTQQQREWHSRALSPASESVTVWQDRLDEKSSKPPSGCDELATALTGAESMRVEVLEDAPNLLHACMITEDSMREFGVQSKEELSDSAGSQHRGSSFKDCSNHNAFSMQTSAGAPRAIFGSLRASSTVQEAIDLDDSDADTSNHLDPKCLNSKLAEQKKSDFTPRQWFLLSLPSQYEKWVERFRKFASIYTVYDRALPKVVRTLERVWCLAEGEANNRGPYFEQQSLPDARRLLFFANDSFSLHWSASTINDEDPHSLKCLSSGSRRILCVTHRACGARMKAADIVRGELQFRRRLLQHLQAGNAAEDELPMCDLPAEGGRAVNARIPAARASVALQKKPIPMCPEPISPEGRDPIATKLIDSLKCESWYRDQITYIAEVPCRQAKFRSLRADLLPVLRSALSEFIKGSDGERGDTTLLQFYSHQALATDAVLADSRNIVLCTSTGSGKSLAYLTVVFDTLLRQSDSTAICIFPTKALAQDQFRAIKRLTAALSKHGAPTPDRLCACLDGDTNKSDRTWIRCHARLVLTNPDTLHCHLLPRHAEYRRLFGGLRVLVLDELHVYRGIFGSHVASVLRRLRRVASCHRNSGVSDFHFIGCSATIANPGEHFAQLIGPSRLPPLVVDEDGSPSGARMHVIWNPGSIRQSLRDPTGLGASVVTDGEPKAKCRRHSKTSPEKLASGLVTLSMSGEGNKHEESSAVISEKCGCDIGWQAVSDEEQMSCRRSPIVQVARLMAWLVIRKVSVLVFCKWRSLVEIVLQDVQAALADCGHSDFTKRVVSYRAGYPVALRRQLESRIFSGDALGVVCTNALELGIDIGGLDCVISLGFPNSVSSLRQQFGRAGRAGRPGLAFFVGFDDPADFHFLQNPDELFLRPTEAIAIASANPVVLKAHLPCAAVEVPIDAIEDGKLWFEDYMRIDPTLDCRIFGDIVHDCVAEGVLCRRDTNSASGVFVFAGHTKEFGPHRYVSIRSIDKNFKVVVQENRGGFMTVASEDGSAVAASHQAFDEVSESKAFYSLHPGAVYRCRGEEYHIVDLNIQRRLAFAVRCESPLEYYTRTSDVTSFSLLSSERNSIIGHRSRVVAGGVHRETRVKSFRRYWKSSDMPHETDVQLDLPSWRLRTSGLWFETTSRSTSLDWAGAHAAMHALLKALPLFVVSEPGDVCAACVDKYGASPMDEPRLLLHDSSEGGLGLCFAAFNYAEKLLQQALDMIEGCPCGESGCPACVIDVRCSEYNRLISKQGAVAWLRHLLDVDQTTLQT